MAKPVLSAKHFHDEEAAYAYVEARVWPKGPVCPKCGENKRVGKLGGKSTRIGVHKCYVCRKPFSVKVGTVFEDSKVPMHLWLQAMHFLCAGKKGVSSNQLARVLGVQLNTAWFMSHRIREAMRDDILPPMRGPEGQVEADETYFGNKDEITTRTIRGKSGHSSKRSIVALVERGGSVRSFHVDRATKATVTEIVAENVSREADLHTDESRLYGAVSGHVAAHYTVHHSSGQYVDGSAYTNTVEGVFSIFKRGMKGVYQHCGEKHLHRYLAEFDFRYNQRIALGVNDTMRAERALVGIKGKRLTYRLP